MSAFVANYARAFVAPRPAFEALLADERRLALGAAYVAVPAALYTLMYVMLTLGHGAPSSFAPWLNIAREDYYAANRFLAAPSMFMCWILAAGVVQILSHLVGGKGRFEDCLAVLGLSIAVAMWATLGHDLVMSFLGAIHVIDAQEHERAMNTPTVWRTLIWTLMIAYLAWFLVLFSKAVGAAHKLGRAPAIALGVTGFAVFQTVYFIFNR
ncbi:MAG: YIP1 family protein [Myxococcales bacterium]